MTGKKKSNDRFKPEELKKLLHSYWLVSDYGIMAAGIEQVVRTYTEGKRVVVVVQKGAASTPITDTLKAMRINHGEEMVQSYRELRDFTHSTKGLSNNVAILKMPTLADRVEDFELLLPFAYELALRELNSEQRQRIESIEGGFILSALVLLKFGRYGLREIVRGAIDCREAGIIWGAENLGVGADKADVSEFVRDVPPAAGAYIGLGRKGSHEERNPRNTEELYPAHEMKLEFLSLANRDIDDSTFLYPRLPCAVEIEPESLGMLAANFAYWYRGPEMTPNNPALYTLKQRLWGHTEEEIHKGFGDEYLGGYMSILKENHIGLISKESRDVLHEWEEARDQLFRKNAGLAAEPTEFITLAHKDVRQESSTTTPENDVEIPLGPTNQTEMESSGKPVVVVWTNYGPEGQISIDEGPRKEPPGRIVKGVASMIRQQKEGGGVFDRLTLLRDAGYRHEEMSNTSISNVFRNYDYIYSLIRKYKDETERMVKNRYIFDVDMTKSRIDELPPIHKS
ncbi:MAG: hypothetical protein ABIK83_13810 [Candidatus Zixiibacteriota bacterium]